MEISTSVQTLINQFELMAQTNVMSSASRAWSVSKLQKKTTLPKADNALTKDVIERAKTQCSCTQLQDVRLTQYADKSVKPDQELSEKAEGDLVRSTLVKAAVYKGLTINTFDKYDTTTRDSIDFTLHSTIPRYSLAHSTTSTYSMNLALTSFGLLPEKLQTSSVASAKIVVNCSQSILHDNLQLSTTSELIPPMSPRLYLLTENQPSTTTKESTSLASNSTYRSSKSTRCTVVSSPPAAVHSSSTSSPRYMNYDSSPRYAATKAWNMERRRQLEERYRSLTAEKARLSSSTSPHVPSTSKRHGRLDHVRSRLYNVKDKHGGQPNSAVLRRLSPPIQNNRV